MDYVYIDQAKDHEKMIQIVKFLILLEQKKQIPFDLNAVKRLQNSNEYFAVFGHVRKCQQFFSSNRNQNAYYHIPELIHWKILYYFHFMAPKWLTKQWESDNEKWITIAKAFIQCDENNDGLLNKAEFIQFIKIGFNKTSVPNGMYEQVCSHYKQNPSHGLYWSWMYSLFKESNPNVSEPYFWNPLESKIKTIQKSLRLEKKSLRLERKKSKKTEELAQSLLTQNEEYKSQIKELEEQVRKLKAQLNNQQTK